MRISMKLSFVFFVLLIAAACSSEENTKATEAATTPVATTTTIQDALIAGVVTAMEQGKDGYTATIRTATNEVYTALVSIINVGGIDNFKSCKIGDKVRFHGVKSIINQRKHLQVDRIINIDPGPTRLVISENAFRGIQVGDAIEKHSDYIQKGQIKTAEGNVEIYRIKDFNNNPAGFFYADPKDEQKVGTITVESKMATTAEGIKVGSRFRELLKQVPELEVHGSEVEGRAHATFNNLSYRLDVPIFKYKVSTKSVPDSTRIIQIIINK